ncbi:RagB/SusD family nutrient uptake outer membrane protein [Sphingobacterium phlebotomi]|uniref:RagB/SusD family nutrient uptake outer membrane protein n=1 Tax=Sphingobacterium phlebotomi TaxID=2605433 RepID=A0A5D4HF25_9SPHI|nr:RagB/SusD family nutrient uptake outer membrane protein [Sphingobacterium phlebotomi]TYR37440.1 RagB/SusD family nutrient uptake outer membrane protein [Sphingobacterium phlebotomi]
MKKRNNILIIYLRSVPLIIIILLISGCEKFLDEKPDRSLAIPSTLKDLQALLDYHAAFTNDSNAGEISSDDFYVTQADWASLSSEAHRRAYTWEGTHLFETGSIDWSIFSTAVYHSNSVLEGLQNIERDETNASEYDHIMGQALLFRAKNILGATFIWCLAYDEATASTDLGLPLRQNTDFNEISVRSSLQETYDQVIADLKKSIQLLPTTPISYIRASRPAAYACLSRAYLSMRRYEEAGRYADSCLQIFNDLIDYNTLTNSTATYPFVELNKEVILQSLASPGQILNLTRGRIVDELYESYAENDLRKTLFFTTNTDNSHGFKGRYSGSVDLFLGLATDEMYLTRAECFAREEKIDEALADLNTLLITRWETGTFSPLSASNATNALNIILEERRKQLVFRGLRWMDLKRLNKEEANITLKRTMNGKEQILYPNDLRYALPIPEDIIELTGMPQNFR